MTTDPEEAVRLQGYGEMTLRTAVATMMALVPRDRANTAVFRIRDGERLASGEIADLAAEWGIIQTGDIRSSPARASRRHWPAIVRGMVREAPLPALMVAFMLGVVVARR
ncbi:hypothetical protein JQ554_26565 [Bradyrhizobium diazoefficiens]|jgi:hypothetical protein|nr:hypothetical protein [Bradyrhizobium diazoefficiens]UCF51762.1 MAG: hypothetical protein JSV48_20635 [Bradyrhizobium sp.]MBR0967710.1 hypothetical protein [Bradyrhizobium diazoefficiens]MBR0981104.1 hypothetical protein [Bradyrhizobium diazoefficiens]MBR1010581.1 hypothetical protein [Bradyrhizobium diazoefficiens]MBR1017237.1 hypothetical protein [Bradyrhizobium diazoefficiens]